MICENYFPIHFFEFVLKFERHEHRDGTSIVDGDQEGVTC